MEQLDKESYIEIVRFTLRPMVELAAEDKTYNLTADTIHYYETAIVPEGVISTDEFLELRKEAGIK